MEKTAPVNDFGRTVPSVVAMTTPMSLHPDHYKFSSLSNTTVVTIFLNVCLWRRSLYSNLGSIDPEKLYRATLIRDNAALAMGGMVLLLLGQSIGKIILKTL